jgi:ketosteroid isomerase-like protein
MSQENLEIVRRAVEAFNSGDLRRIVALTHPDFDGVVPAEISAEPDSYRGHDGIRRYFNSFHDAMDQIRFEGDRFCAVGDSVVFALRLTAKGRQTAIAVEQRSAGVWSVREGKIVRIRAYASLEQARRAVGLDGG